MSDSVDFEVSRECNIINSDNISFFTVGNKGSIAYIGLDGDWVIVHAVGGHGNDEMRRACLNPPCECKFGVFSADDESRLLLVDKNDALRVFDVKTGKVDSVEPPKDIADDQTNGNGQQHFVSEFDTVTSAAAIPDKSDSRFLISTCNSLIDLYVSSSEKCKTHKTGGFGFDIIKVLLPCLWENGQWLVLASYDSRYVGLGEHDGTFYPLIESSDGEILDAQMSRSGECLAMSFSTNKHEVICWDIQTVLMEKNTELGDQRCAVSGLRLQGLDGPSRVCWCSSGEQLITFDGDECALWDVSNCSGLSGHVKEKSDAMILSGLDSQIFGLCSHPCLGIAGILGTTMLSLFKTDSFRNGGVQAPFASIDVPLKVSSACKTDICWGIDGKIIIRSGHQIVSVDVRSKIDATDTTRVTAQLSMHLIPRKSDQDVITTPCKESERVHQDVTMLKDDEASKTPLSALHGLKSKLGKIRTRPKSPKDQDQSLRYMASSSVKTPKKPAFQPPLYNYYSSPTYIAIDSAKMVPGPCSPPMGYFPMSPEGHYSWAGYPGSQVYYAHPNTLPVWYNDGGGGPAVKNQCSQNIMQQGGLCGTPHHPAVHGYSMMTSGQAYGPFIGSSSTSSGTHSSLSGEYEIFRMSMDQPIGSATQSALSSLESDQMYKQRKPLDTTSQRLQSPDSCHHPSEATIYIGNLPNGFQEDSIAYMCSPCGSIFDIQIIRDKITKISRGYAFVTFLHPEEAQHAIQNLNGQVLQGPYGQTHMLRVGPSNRKFTCQALRDVVSEETNHLNKSRGLA
eukprot:jgi/Picsp_1/813/NSC_04302-R1_zinc finger cchc-type and rna-binding motif-containing protein 1-like